jgi:uncharacterized protein YndB with AHSA1/START domain
VTDAAGRTTVAYTSREVMASATQAFSVLTDPTTYPRWLVGARAIRDVDDAWPQPGSKFHHVVGFGPFRIADYTEVLDVDDGVMLRLKVRARPWISAIATFRVLGSDQRCVIALEEEPGVKTVGALVRPVMDPTVHVRNHRSLRLLAEAIEEQSLASHRCATETSP